MTVILPIIAILSVTSEWSQRSGLTTFTPGPPPPSDDRREGARVRRRRGGHRAASARARRLGNVVGTRIAGVEPVWDLTVTNMATILSENVLGLVVGFMLGVLVRSSAGAIVGYFVYSFLLPTLAVILARSQAWFRHLQPWVDFKFAQGTLVDGTVTAQQWATPRRHGRDLAADPHDGRARHRGPGRGGSRPRWTADGLSAPTNVRSGQETH